VDLSAVVSIEGRTSQALLSLCVSGCVAVRSFGTGGSAPGRVVALGLVVMVVAFGVGGDGGYCSCKQATISYCFALVSDSDCDGRGGGLWRS
ncbi:Hypothetical predicted protein, partial [Olea europaea subsp. europaea]